jgi:threonine synthase
VGWPALPHSGSASALVCTGCGTLAPAGRAFVPRCLAARDGDDVDHVLRRVLDHTRVAELEAAGLVHADEPNPFLRYRTRLHAWHVARMAGWADERFVDLVRGLDDAVGRTEGHGFHATPLLHADRLDAALGLTTPGGLWAKDETGNVSGSHKARHLFGVMLALRVDEEQGLIEPGAPLAIASCGNAALAAAVVARAAERRLLVFVPPSAEAAVLARLRELRAEVHVCERRPGETGDPTVRRLLAAMEAGAVPFTVQGDLDGPAIEGGATLGWELVDGLAAQGARALDRLVIQVGGGAFASAMALALEDAQGLGRLERLPRFDTVQTRGGYPLARAHDRVLEHLGATASMPLAPDRVRGGLADVARHRSAYMWAWETEPRSSAHGILDDETYDWLAVVRAMLSTGGRSVVVDEDALMDANRLVVDQIGIDADHTGTAGLAGLLTLRHDGLVDADETVAVIFSGVRRGSIAAQPPPRGNDRP